MEAVAGSPGHTGTGVAHAHQFHRAKNCSEAARTEAAMRVEPFLASGLHQQGRTDIAGTALLQVILKQQALDFTAFVGLLRLDVVEGEAKGTGRGQPGLRQSELDSSRGRIQRQSSCGVHK